MFRKKVVTITVAVTFLISLLISISSCPTVNILIF